jgi:hypothetical protein
MKNDRVFLAEWLGDPTDGYNDIPWPMVHEWAGYDCIRWINSRSEGQCQMVLERGTDFSQGFVKLYVEFFDPKLRTEFAVRFAK